MKVIIMRHGEASMHADSDANRPLTQHGILQASQVGTWLETEGQIPDIVWVSPYLRTQQTWHYVGEAFTNQMEVITNNDITPNGQANNIAQKIQLLITQLAGTDLAADLPACDKTLMIVSHLPLVGYLVEALCENEDAPMFSTADLACVVIKGNREGELIWHGGLMTPP